MKTNVKNIEKCPLFSPVPVVLVALVFFVYINFVCFVQLKNKADVKGKTEVRGQI